MEVRADDTDFSAEAVGDLCRVWECREVFGTTVHRNISCCSYCAFQSLRVFEPGLWLQHERAEAGNQYFLELYHSVYRCLTLSMYSPTSGDGSLCTPPKRLSGCPALHLRVELSSVLHYSSAGCQCNMLSVPLKCPNHCISKGCTVPGLIFPWYCFNKFIEISQPFLWTSFTSTCDTKLSPFKLEEE